LQNILRPYYDSVFNPPLFITKKVLLDSKYFDNFPHQLFSATNFDSDSECYVTPAACLHVYPELENKSVTKYGAFGTAHCARYEDGQWQPPYRLKDFHMTELVVVGSEEEIKEKINEIRDLLEITFTDLSFRGDFQNATDAFFLGQDDGAKMIQQLKGLKQEFVVQDGENKVALASVNNHEDFFGKRFNIKSNKIYSHSLCVAFGIERLTAYSLKIWGGDQDKWPKKFKDYAKIS
ncbi:MAG: aminoacyl--tRNA ligase-related protein, partial [Candidatus Paceibacterota bacterium]